MFASKDVFLKSTGGYTIARSVRLRSSASAYLSRTPASASNRTTWTWSGWVKRGTLGVSQAIFSGGTGNNRTYLFFDSSNNLEFHGNGSILRVSTNVYRDPSAWYHIVWVLDTNNATAQNRTRIYINNVEITSWSTNVTISSGATFDINAVDLQTIGKNSESGGTSYFDGYLTEINFIDGQALTPSSFGAISTNGVWQPARYTGTYGTNGFYLKFADNSTAAALGTDSSGNSNTWTVNNISITAGATYDSMTDVPTLTSATAANYAVLNPNATYKAGNAFTLSNANLTYTQATCTATTTVGTSVSLPYGAGKFYYEVTQISKTAVGGDATAPFQLVVYNYASTGATYSNFSYSLTGNGGGGDPTGAALTGVSSIANNDVVMVAIDLVNGKLFLGKNGTWFNSGDPAAGTGAVSTNLANYSVFVPAVGNNGGNMTNFSCALNFGQRPFTYTAPTGFVALNTYNLSTPTIANGAGYMAVTLYTGTNATQSITNTVNNVSFQPDFVWIKGRSVAASHNLFDSVRGPRIHLESNLTDAEYTESAGVSLTAFNSNGFALGTDNAGPGQVNGNGNTYVGWQWKANGAGVSNTSGSITSTVSAGTTQGFSVVTYTGTGANATVGHGLGVAPSMIITKNRGAVSDWGVYHTSLGNTNYVLLDTTAASAASITYWNNTFPTSSVFSIGTATPVNVSTNTYVAYCFAAVAGYSAFGSYTGNGSTDGPFVYLGFRPRWVMVKRTDATSDWYIWDTTRDTYNVVAATLLADTSGAETSATSIDDLSNGFKCRSATVVNVSTGTYIYAAFAENPFKYSLAR